MSQRLKLTLACGRYDRTQPLIDGRVEVEGVDLTFLPLRPGETFWRMLNHGEFDVSEMSLSSYTILRSEGDTRFIAIPIFPSRVFRHSAVYLRADSKIAAPADLKGKRVGVADYQMTAAVWARGFLSDDYGVKPENIHWVIGRPVRTIKPPPNIAYPSSSRSPICEATSICTPPKAMGKFLFARWRRSARLWATSTSRLRTIRKRSPWPTAWMSSAR